MTSVSTFFARIIARELQLSTEQWSDYLQGTQQTHASITEQRQIPLCDFNTLLDNALRLSDDPGLGLRFGRYSNILALGESGLAIVSAPNLLEALRATEDFSRLSADYMELNIQVGLERVHFRACEHEPMGRTTRAQHEVFILSMQNTIEMVLGRPFTEGHYHFAYPEPSYADRYQDVFTGTCTFNAAETGLDIPWALMKSPSPYYDQVLWEQGRDRCVALMNEHKDNHKALYSQHILMTLRSQKPPLPDAGDIAQAMNLSTRTLMRRLDEEGSTYRGLKSRVLQEWAHRYLVDTDITVDALAAQLGYQDSANFRRAFKRWVGSSPAQYRSWHA